MIALLSLILFAILINIFIIYKKIAEIREFIEDDIKQESKYFADKLLKESIKLVKIETLMNQNSNGSFENFKNKLKSILNNESEE